MWYKTSKPPVIDSHAHVYALTDPDGAIAEAKESGLTGIVVPGEDLASNRLAVELSGRYPDFIFPAVGYHPDSIRLQDLEATISDVKRNLPHCIALGEIGLDYKASLSKKHQKAVFSLLLDIASAHDKPVIVHARYVHETALSMVREAGVRRAVFHAFNGSREVLFDILDAGFYISATPSAGHNERHAAALRLAPLDRILLETDAPIVWGGVGGRPVHCWTSLDALAFLKNADTTAVAEHAYRNTIALFQMPMRDLPNTLERSP